MANFLFYRYHFVPAEEPDLFAQEELDVPHYPYTLVIVDARQGFQAILVQQKKSAFNNPDAVARLVAEYCSCDL